MTTRECPVTGEVCLSGCSAPCKVENGRQRGSVASERGEAAGEGRPVSRALSDARSQKAPYRFVPPITWKHRRSNVIYVGDEIAELWENAKLLEPPDLDTLLAADRYAERRAGLLHWSSDRVALDIIEDLVKKVREEMVAA